MTKKKQKSSHLTAEIMTFVKGKWFGPFMIMACFLFLLLVRMGINLPTFGDEPHYMLSDYSLVHDHDLNLTNNYANHDYSSFFDGKLTPQGNPDPKDIRTIHGDGLPFLLLPGFAIDGKWGAAIEMVMVATLVVWLTYVWTKQITKNKKAAYIAAGLLTICFYFANLAGYVYPDLPLAATFLASLIILDKYYNRPWMQFLLGAILGFGLLLHFRTFVFIVPIFLILAWRLWRNERKLPWQALTAFLIFGGIYYYYEAYLSGVSAAPSVTGSGGSLNGNGVINLSALLFDSNKGLLSLNPILLLLPIGLPIWFKEHKRSLIIAFIALAPTMYTTIMFIEWHGGYAPTGRYMMSILPVFIPALAFAVMYLKATWQKVIIWLLGITSVVIILDAIRSHYALIDPNKWSQHPFFAHIQHATGIAVDKLLPAFVTDLTHGDTTNLVHPGAIGVAKIVVWYCIVIALGAYGWWLSRAVQTKQSARRKKT
ncbi:MAG TPA: phospholipid carrier-dependent glycosyltransferase [Candidatus Saccharimonas sp.]|nr:phospholipid carrier-dependent glycosyltransferase [Candidatus Saccharimonas sp.]